MAAKRFLDFLSSQVAGEDDLIIEDEDSHGVSWDDSIAGTCYRWLNAMLYHGILKVCVKSTLVLPPPPQFTVLSRK
jgi:hypothetical protein